MTPEEFVAATSVIAQVGFNDTQRAALKDLHAKVCDDTAFEIAEGVDKQHRGIEKERVSEQGD